jgi:hypothetical protein
MLPRGFFSDQEDRRHLLELAEEGLIRASFQLCSLDYKHLYNHTLHY